MWERKRERKRGSTRANWTHPHSLICILDLHREFAYMAASVARQLDVLWSIGGQITGIKTRRATSLPLNSSFPTQLASLDYSKSVNRPSRVNVQLTHVSISSVIWVLGKKMVIKRRSKTKKSWSDWIWPGYDPLYDFHFLLMGII